MEQIGINAELRVPSRSIRLNKLGIVKASKKASPKKEVPKVAKNKTSLNNPSTLEIRVPPLTTEKLLKKLKGADDI